MRVRELLSTGALLALSTACATSLDFKRPQSPLYTLNAGSPGVALIDVNTGNIENSCGGAEGNIAETLKSSIRDYVTAQQPAFQFADKTSLGLKADFNATPAMDGITPIIKVSATIPAIPESVESPLVSAIYVMQLKCGSKQDLQNKTVPTVEVKYAFTTWTKGGQLVSTEIINGAGTGGDLGSPKTDVEPRDSGRWESFANRVGRRAAKERLPSSAGELITLATKDAVAFHYFPFFTQQIEESFGMRDDGALKAGVDLAKAGKFDEALAAWEQITTADAKAHGAFFNIAVVQLAKGSDDKAAEAIEKAIAIESSMKYKSLRDNVKGRLALRKTL